MLATSEHTVRPGETLGGIAARHGTTVAHLAEANGIDDADRIRAGQVLSLPGGAAAATAAAEDYTVRAGDTLSAIAARSATSVAALADANDISDPDRIRAGQRLRLAGASAGSGGSGSAGSGDSSSAPGGSGTVVKAGDTLATVAARTGVPAQQLRAANGIVSDRIYVGQRLALAPPSTGPLPDAIRCPVPGARFMNDWGFPRSGGRFHRGNDLFAPAGTPVLAPAGGVVAHRTGPVGGRQVVLTAGDGTVYVGTHLDAFGPAGSVSAGDVIGYVGDSGNARGGPPHLHFEIRPGGGEAVNPYPLLVAAC